MTSTIDERVVRLALDNQQFEQNVSTSLASIDKLSKGLKFEGATKGLDDVSSSAKRFSLDGIASGIDAIAGKFKTMSIVGITAITNVVNKAVDAGINLAKSLSVNPIMAGLHEYETNLNAIQTVMANTGLSGQKGLNKVNASLNELNTYSDKTIYNFSEMAKNIGTFTAAGVSLKTSTAAIKGIANLAAVSGSNAEQASTAMYQLSQALAAGKVSLQDWNSVVNAGMGGKVFQQALMETARVHGVAIDKMVKDEGGFRNTLQKGWLTSSILTETLNKFTGDLSAKQLKAMGYNKKQIADIIKMGKTAQDAATKVKTMSQLIDTLQEAVGSGWTKTWQLLFGDFDEARTLFTNVSNVLGGFITTSSNARNKVIGDWKALGGRTVLIDSIAMAFHALIAVIKPIKDAFREIFPATTGKQLFEFTKSIHVFVENLLISTSTADKLKRTFAGVFAVFGLVIDVVKMVVKTLVGLVKTATQGSGGILDFTAKIGDFLVALRKAIKDGDDLTKFFSELGLILAVPIQLLRMAASYISHLFDGFKGADASQAAKSVVGLGEKLDPLGKLINFIAIGGRNLVSVFDLVWQKVLSISENVISFFSRLGSSISGTLADAMSGIDYGKVLDGINIGLFSGLLLLIKQFVAKFHSGDSGLGGIVHTITESFEELNKTLAAMQQTLKAAALLEIALAIGVLTISVVALSKIDADSLTRSLTAIAVMFTELFASMAIFNKIAGSSGFAKMSLVTGAMILLAIAVDLLVIAVKQLAGLDWKELAKGLTGVSVILAAFVATVKLMPPASGMISTGLGLVAIAAAIKILVSAVTDLSGLSWKELAKGVTAVASVLIALALFTKFSDANKAGVLQGAGIVLLATAMKILASAMKDFSGLSWKDIGKGLTVMAVGLALIANALILIPPTAVLSAAGVLIVAASLQLISDALKSMGKMTWGAIGKGITVLAGALTLIAAALYLLPPESLISAAAILVVAASLQLIVNALQDMAKMSWSEIGKSLVELAGALLIIANSMLLMVEALPGAAALLVVTASLLLLLPVLIAFGNMSWEEIGKGLLMLAGVFVVIGLAGLALAPLTPVLLALGAAILLLGLGVLAAGAGVLLFASALTALSVAGAVGAAAMTAIVTGLIGLIPTVMKELGLGIVAFAGVISTAGPAITKAITVVLLALISAIAILTPKIVNTLLSLLLQLLNALAKYVPKMVDAGLRLITGILTGIANNISKVVAAATNVVVNFINSLGKSSGKIIQAGAAFIVTFINGVATAVRNNSKPLGDAGANLGTAIVEGMISGMGAGISRIATEAANMGSAAIHAAKHILDSHSPSKEFIKIGNDVNNGFVIGLMGNKGQIDAAFNTLRSQLSTAINDSAKSMESLQSKLSKLTHARHKDTSEIKETRKELAQATKEHKAEAAAYTEVTKNLNNSHTALGKLATQYDTLTTKIKNANDALANAIKTRDDFNTSVTDQYKALPDITDTTTVSDYVVNLKKEIEDTKQFSNTLQRLRKFGLSDDAYKQLLGEGVSALPFANQLLAGGATAINQINDLDKQLDTAAAALGKSASTALYQAAVDSAAGLVKGLQNQQSAIEKQMEKIAIAMINAINKKLGIKSPAKAFIEVAGYSVLGLVKGFQAMSSVAEKSAADVGDASVESLRQSLSGFSDLIVGSVKINPTITPVLDLSSVKKDSGQLGNMLAVRPISVDSAYNKARFVAEGYATSQNGTDPSGANASGPALTFNQYNNSPKALSAADVYRQTKNQLSVVKGALPTV